MVAIGIAVYGVIAFVNRKIGSYMFLKNEFVFFDFEKFTVTGDIKSMENSVESR